MIAIVIIIIIIIIIVIITSSPHPHLSQSEPKAAPPAPAVGGGGGYHHTLRKLAGKAYLSVLLSVCKERRSRLIHILRQKRQTEGARADAE